MTSSVSTSNDSNSRRSSRFCFAAVLLSLVVSLTLYNTTKLIETFDWSFDSAGLSFMNGLSNKTAPQLQDIITALNYTPEALLPVTFDKCCGEGATDYERVCLTEQACRNDTLYPFRSQQEKKMHSWWKPTREEKLKHLQTCQQANAQMQPPTKWCSHDDNSTTQFPMGCSHYSMGGGSGPYDRLLLFPSGKLAFCGVPKAGITQWLQFLRFTIGSRDYQSFPYFKKDLAGFYLDRLDPEAQQTIWNNSTTRWTRAIFLRNPAERLLSAYLDKVYTKPPPKTKEIKRFPPFGFNVSFQEFVDYIAMVNVTKMENHSVHTGLSWMTDPHWRPQAWSCGVSEHLADFDCVGSLDRAAAHTKLLLQHTNLWESFGKHYRVSPVNTTNFNPSLPPPFVWPPPLSQKAIGFQQEDEMDTFLHGTGSKLKLEQYYTPELMEKVKKLYWMDFELWEAVEQVSNNGGMASGRDVAKILNPDCK